MELMSFAMDGFVLLREMDLRGITNRAVFTSNAL